MANHQEEPTVSSEPAKGSTRVRSMVFTLNNWTDAIVDDLVKWATTNCRYLVYGKEIAPTTGTPHLQGYCQLNKQTRLSTLSKLFKWRTDITRGTPQQASDYCKKEGNFIEIGEISLQEKGGDKGGELEKQRWARNLQLAAEGKLQQIAEEDPQAYTRCLRTYQEHAQICKIKEPQIQGFTFLIDRPWCPQYTWSERITFPINRETGYCVKWLVGPAAVGKTFILKNQHDDEGKLIKVFDVPESKDFSGYNGESIIGINEFQGCFTPTQIIKWTEEAPVNGKYMKSFNLPPNILVIVTSNSTPQEVFHNIMENNPSHLQAFLTRCHVIHLECPNPKVATQPKETFLDRPAPEELPEPEIVFRNPFAWIKKPGQTTGLTRNILP